jgi:hypothetical protein
MEEKDDAGGKSSECHDHASGTVRRARHGAQSSGNSIVLEADGIN